MKKLVCAVLVMMMTFGLGFSLAEELQMPEVKWDYPVPLIEIQSEYSMLVNSVQPQLLCIWRITLPKR